MGRILWSMLEQTQDAVLTDGERFLPIEEVALALRLSPRKLKELLAQNGLATYSFGSRTKRVRESDLRQLIHASAEVA
jgi:excisionase family DNA binding protein